MAATRALIGRGDENQIDERYTLAFADACHIRFAIENARDGGQTWSSLLAARYTRAALTK